MAHVLAVLARTAVLAVVGALTLVVVNRLSGPMVGANIGAGVAVFAAVALGSLIWAYADARRSRVPGTVASGGGTTAPLVGRWLAVGALLGVVGAVVPSVLVGRLDGKGPSVDWGVVAGDVRTGVPFAVVVVGVAALVGIGLARWRS